jgi:MFS family permease
VADDTTAILSRRAEWTAYIASFFSVAILPMANLVVPLWALHIGASALEIGVIMGARSLLPFLFAIHTGALIDRLGTRRVMLFSALFSLGLTLAYPALPHVGTLIALQVVIGQITTMGWIGAQTHIAQLTRGNPVYMGRFTSISILSNFIGPLAAGFAWDRLGVWGAFGLMAIWAAAMWVAVMVQPKTGGTANSEPARRSLARLLVPDIADYRAAFRLALIPAVGLIIATSFLHNAALSMRFSFYVVYLESVGMAGTVIGFLVGVASLVGAISALATAPLARIVPPHRIAIAMIMVSTVAITATPLASEFVGLFLLACVFGFGNGLGFAQIIAILARVVPADQLGLTVGLRITVNRFSSLTIPVMMGAMVHGFDLATAFFAVGAVLALAVISVALVMTRIKPL